MKKLILFLVVLMCIVLMALCAMSAGVDHPDDADDAVVQVDADGQPGMVSSDVAVVFRDSEAKESSVLLCFSAALSSNDVNLLTLESEALYYSESDNHYIVERLLWAYESGAPKHRWIKA